MLHCFFFQEGRALSPEFLTRNPQPSLPLSPQHPVLSPQSRVRNLQLATCNMALTATTGHHCKPRPAKEFCETVRLLQLVRIQTRVRHDAHIFEEGVKGCHPVGAITRRARRDKTSVSSPIQGTSDTGFFKKWTKMYLFRHVCVPPIGLVFRVAPHAGAPEADAQARPVIRRKAS